MLGRSSAVNQLLFQRVVMVSCWWLENISKVRGNFGRQFRHHFVKPLSPRGDVGHCALAFYLREPELRVVCPEFWKPGTRIAETSSGDGSPVDMAKVSGGPGPGHQL